MYVPWDNIPEKLLPIKTVGSIRAYETFSSSEGKTKVEPIEIAFAIDNGNDIEAEVLEIIDMCVLAQSVDPSLSLLTHDNVLFNGLLKHYASQKDINLPTEKEVIAVLDNLPEIDPTKVVVCVHRVPWEMNKKDDMTSYYTRIGFGVVDKTATHDWMD